MRITDAEITGFKLHKSKKSYSFGHVNRISGGNGKGKTTISEAITWCFYGCDLTGKTKEVFERLKNKSAKETKVDIGVDWPQKDGTTARYQFCRVRKGKVTSLFLNGHAAKQGDFDRLLGPMELFLSIFVPGYFGTIGISEPTKARNMLVLMLPKIENAVVTANLNEDDRARIESYDMVNPDFMLKKLRAEILELDKSLDKVQGKIDYLRIKSMLDVPMSVVVADEKKLVALKDEFTRLMRAVDGAKPDLHDLAPLQEKKASLRFQYDERLKQFKALKEKPLPKAGDHCPACEREHTASEAAAELETRKARLLELQSQCETIKQEGYLLASETEQKTNENAEIMAVYQANRGNQIEALQAEIEALSSIVAERDAKLKMGTDLTTQHEIYGEIVVEREEKKVDMQTIKNFMLQYAEMQVEYVNSFLNLAKIQLFKYSGSTGEMTLDFTILYGEEETEYKSLSTSEKIRCSIELSGLLNRVQNISYPVYIDNAESVESFDEPGTQYFVSSVVPRAALQSEIVA
ncbi:AAA family ATPase [Paenibacillus ihuae]|uniref:AAA family ATPase n=1 Tax=Paenibacillus ihuae TaxID=1232431 RepID=UPI0006D54A32|nr:AAA family ATPase [Paenibacillus ihuae]